VRLALYVKKHTCLKEGQIFKSGIQLACEEIGAFTPPVGTRTTLLFDSWFFCHQIVEAATASGWDRVTQAESNRIIHHEGRGGNVAQLAESLSEKCFKPVKVKDEAFTLFGVEVWMPKTGNVKLVVSREKDGFHFYVTNRLDWSNRQVLEAYKGRHTIDDFYRDVKQNSGLEVRGVSDAEGPRSHHTLAAGLHRLYSANPPT